MMSASRRTKSSVFPSLLIFQSPSSFDTPSPFLSYLLLIPGIAVLNVYATRIVSVPSAQPALLGQLTPFPQFHHLTIRRLSTLLFRVLHLVVVDIDCSLATHLFCSWFEIGIFLLPEAYIRSCEVISFRSLLSLHIQLQHCRVAVIVCIKSTRIQAAVFFCK